MLWYPAATMPVQPAIPVPSDALAHEHYTHISKIIPKNDQLQLPWDIQFGIWLDKNNLNQRQFAELIGKTPQQLSQVLRGKASRPVLRAIEVVTGIDCKIKPDGRKLRTKRGNYRKKINTDIDFEDQGLNLDFDVT